MAGVLAVRDLCSVARAHAKAILLGEHTVVYGTPAISLPLPEISVTAAAAYRGKSLAAQSVLTRGPAAAVAQACQQWNVSTPIDIVMSCGIPPARGLGSSAACAAAAVRAVAQLSEHPLTADELFELVQVGERVAHGRASGVDARTVVANTMLWFADGKSVPMTCDSDAWLVLADSGTAGSTAEAVGKVRARLEQDPHAAKIIGRAAELVSEAATDLKSGAVRSLGGRLTEFHGILQDLGVSTPVLDRLVTAALQAGAVGAKLTGGGLGGCVLALVDNVNNPASNPRTDPAVVGAALQTAGATRIWTTELRC